MAKITLPQEAFNKVIHDVEVLIEDVSELIDQDKIVEKRLEDIRQNPSIGKSEQELDTYLKKRGVKVELDS